MLILSIEVLEGREATPPPGPDSAWGLRPLPRDVLLDFLADIKFAAIESADIYLHPKESFIMST